MGGFGGRSGSGGPLIRSVGRAVRATGVGGEVSRTTNANACGSSARASQKKPSCAAASVTIAPSISNSSSIPCPISAISTAPSLSSPFLNCDEWDWEAVDASDDGSLCGCFEDCVFGSAPSSDEAQAALYSLQQALDPSSSELSKDKFFTNSDKDKAIQISAQPSSMCWVGSDSDWNEPSPLVMVQGLDRVYEAFHLLQTEPSVQRMVISLSSDEAVWDAVMKNKMVQQLKESFNAAEKEELQSSDKEGSSVPNPAVCILKRIFSSTKAKLADVIQKISEIVNQLSKSSVGEEMGKVASEPNPFEKRVKASLMVSLMILLIVVLTRASRA